MPYIMFVVGMADAPGVDYDKKEDKEKENVVHKTAKDEIASVMGLF